MKAPEKRVRRGLALALLALTVMLLWVIVVAPLVRYASDGWVEHRHSVARLAQLRDLMGREQELRAAVASLEQDPGWTKLYRAPSPTAATAMAQSDIQSVAQSLGIAIASIEPLAERHLGQLSNVGARVTFTTTIDVLMSFANRLATSPKRLLIEDITIIAPQMHADGDNPLLNVQADVYGVWWR